MPARKKKLQVRCVEEYRAWNGSIFRTYVTAHGLSVETVCVRTGFFGARRTNAWARAEAIRQLSQEVD